MQYIDIKLNVIRQDGVDLSASGLDSSAQMRRAYVTCLDADDNEFDAELRVAHQLRNESCGNTWLLIP